MCSTIRWILRAKGVEVIQKSWGDEKHPEPHVFLINQKDELAKEANDEEAAFFRRHIVKRVVEKTIVEMISIISNIGIVVAPINTFIKTKSYCLN